MRRIVLLALLGLLLAPAAAQARPSFATAHSMAAQRAWRDCYALWPLDPYSRRCATIRIVSGYAAAGTRCWYFRFVTLTNRAGSVYRERIRVCTNAHGGATASTYFRDGFLAGTARVRASKPNVVVRVFGWLGL